MGCRLHSPVVLLIYDYQVRTYNRTGTPYRGSYDIWTRNWLASLLDQTAAAFLPQSQYPECSMIGWVNGREYERSTESFGILPLDENTQTKFGMLVYHPEFAAEKKIHHRYLAEMQHTCIAVLPIHTSHERALYQLLVQKPNGLFSGKSQPNWVAVATEWMQHADGIQIFYKVCHGVNIT